MSKQEFSIPTLANQITTEADAYFLLERLRWDGEPVCPHCYVVGGHYFLKPANGTSRKTRTGSTSQRRVWKCHKCRKQFSVLTGTIFHGSKIALRTWLFVIFEMCAAKNGVSAREIERKYDLTAKTAWFMLHRIREAMRRDPLAGLLSGAVQADETWIGGDPKNRHQNDERPRRSPGHTDKTAVFSLVHYQTREVRSRVVPDVTGETLLPAIKRSVDGTHHHVSKEHLPRYLAEFDFRHSTRKMDDGSRMEMLVDRAHGRRLTYKRPASGQE